MSKLGKPVLVTTSHRGVFFGHLVKHDPKAKTATIDKIRNVVYWSADVRGFIGLAATGPSCSCKVSLAGGESTLHDITGIFGCTPEAVEAFAKGPWA